MVVRVRERTGTYRHLTLGLLTLLISISMAFTACKKRDEHQREDYEKAYVGNRDLAEKGDAEAQYNIGLMYDKGMGVPQDDLEAVTWYLKAAEQGDAFAQHSLAIKYVNGHGMPKNDAMAAKWFRKAAQQGLPQSQYNLGLMYNKGMGVPQDNVMAHMWFNLAASRFPTYEGEKREMAEKNRDTVASMMTPDQITEAERLAREWKPKVAGK